MRRSQARGLAVTAVLVLAMVAVVVWSYDYAPAARELPLLVAWATIFLLLLESLVQTGTRPGRVVDRIFSGRVVSAEDARAAEVTGPGAWRELSGILWPVVLVAAIVMIGILPAVSAYVFVSLRLWGAKPITRATATTVGVAAFIWGLFEWGMSYRLYRGAVFGDFQGF